MMTDEKEVSYKKLKPYDKVCGYYIDGAGYRYSDFVVVDSSIAGVWLKHAFDNDDDKAFKVSTDAKFYVPLSLEEYRIKYDAGAKKLLDALENKVSSLDIGPHEMWNGWTDVDIWDFAKNLKEEDLTVIGVCYDIIPKEIVPDLPLDVGVCVEDEIGERFWVHYASKWIADMREEYKEWHQDKRN